MNRLVVVLGFLGLLTASSMADTFTFSYTGSSVSAAGTMQAASEGDGMYVVTAITGMRNGVAIDAVDSAQVFGINDNTVLLDEALKVDFGGLSYTTVDGRQFNLYSSDGFDRESITGSDDGVDVVLSMTQNATTPEPGTLVLLGSGCLAVGGTLRRRLRGGV